MTMPGAIDTTTTLAAEDAPTEDQDFPYPCPLEEGLTGHGIVPPDDMALALLRIEQRRPVLQPDNPVADSCLEQYGLKASRPKCSKTIWPS